MIEIKIKWGNKSLTTSFDPSKGVQGLKEELSHLTSVPPERQKLMCKHWKGILKDDTDLVACNIADGAVVTLIGDAGKPVVVDVPETSFVEDLPVAEQEYAINKLPPGLINEGNTCYMNSVLQCLKAVPELRQALQDMKSTSSSGPLSRSLDNALAELFSKLDSSKQPQHTHAFLQKLRAYYPKFAEMSQMGIPKQQDAEEFQSVIMQSLAMETVSLSTLGNQNLMSLADSDAPPNVIDSFFGIEMDIETQCSESNEERIIVRREGLRRLSANIEGGAGRSVQVNNILEGILHGMQGEVEKRSEVLNRNATWVRRSRISRLPKYICVQLVRFFWKKTNNAPGDGPAGVPCKILKPVAFPATLDCIELCTAPLQSLLRDRRIEVAKSAVQKASSAASSDKNAVNASSAAASFNKKSDDDMDVENDSELTAAIKMSLGEDFADVPSKSPSMGFGPGLSNTFSGSYELFGVVSHKGRDSSSGHYMGWVREAVGSDTWMIFDDDQVTETDTQTVLSRLRGGGDDHMAYIVYYRAVE